MGWPGSHPIDGSTAMPNARQSCEAISYSGRAHHEIISSSLACMQARPLLMMPLLPLLMMPLLLALMMMLPHLILVLLALLQLLPAQIPLLPPQIPMLPSLSSALLALVVSPSMRTAC